MEPLRRSFLRQAKSAPFFSGRTGCVLLNAQMMRSGSSTNVQLVSCGDGSAYRFTTLPDKKFAEFSNAMGLEKIEDAPSGPGGTDKPGPGRADTPPEKIAQ